MPHPALDHAGLREFARRWAADDPDPRTRAAAEALIARDDEAALRDHFGARLEFGTAGLRGALGPGPNRMNRALVRRVTLGLGRYLLEHVPEAARRGVVIGFDGRHGSRDFSADAAGVLAGLGLPVHLFEDVVPTPQLAHAVKHLAAAGGIMVTASHNPPQDNGYKVYWTSGGQILPPHDAGISAAVDAVEGLAGIEVPPLAELRAAGRVSPVPPSVLEAYLTEVDAQRVWTGATDVRIVYTAMHGVGRRLQEAVLDRHGYRDRHLVAAQVDPDPDFPTVKFPNPEEPGALDLALALASEVGADLVVAHDPDADRLAVAIPDGSGGHRALNGNQIGTLLADELLRYGPAERPRMVATTVVSTGMLRRIADAHGVAYAETLTGFKWIADAAERFEATGGRFVYGFEEALGSTPGSVVRDKDGVSAALLFCDLVARCKAEGRTVTDRLTDLAREHGAYATAQHSMTLPGAAGARRIATMMERLRADPPLSLAGGALKTFRDLSSGEARDVATGALTRIDIPPSNVLAFDLEDGSRVLARPSGTEPKIKFYFEVRVPMGANESLADAEARAAARVAELRADLLRRVEA